MSTNVNKNIILATAAALPASGHFLSGIEYDVGVTHIGGNVLADSSAYEDNGNSWLESKWIFKFQKNPV